MTSGRRVKMLRADSTVWENDEPIVTNPHPGRKNGGAATLTTGNSDSAWRTWPGTWPPRGRAWWGQRRSRRSR